MADGSIAVFNLLADVLSENQLSLQDVIFVHWFIRDMKTFSLLNEIYIKYFDVNPPARACIEVELPSSSSVLMEVVVARSKSSRQLRMKEFSFADYYNL